MTATIASPAMSPEATGTMYRSDELRFARIQTIATTEPTNMVEITENGTKMPILTPVGDGTNLRILGTHGGE
jgi:hypothetical protein